MHLHPAKNMISLAILEILLLVVMGPLSGGGVSRAAEPRINEIAVRGNVKIDTYAILAKIGIKEGDPFDREELRADLKAIYQMGFFEDVMISTESLEDGVRVVFTVIEKPFLVKIEFTGNKKIKADTLKDKITLRDQTFVDRQQIKENGEKLRRYYEEEGYFEANVTPVLTTVDEDKVTLTFLIEEGARAKIRRIRFDGRSEIPAKVLRKQIETRRHFWLTSWLTGTGIYKKEILEQDVERIKSVYLDHGYLQVQVGTPDVTLSEDKKWFEIVFPVLQGEEFIVGRISFTGNELDEDDALETTLTLKQGEVFKRNRLQADIRAITDRYGEAGYIFTQVIPHLNPDPTTQTVDVTLNVRERGPISVRRINILGNNKTRDKVIRREIRVNEQEVINTTTLRRSFQRLNNLNFFESVEIVPQELDSEQVDLQVRVKEKPTGSFSVGGGYSSVDRFVGLVEITQGNLFGRGQLLRARLETGGRRTTYSFTFREPYVLDYAVGGTVNLFDQERNFDSYKEERRGGSFSFSREFNEYVSGSLGYGFERLRIFEPNLDGAGNCIAAPIICDEVQRGRTSTSSISMTLARDTRDFFFDPSRGGRNVVSYEHAGTFLRGTNDFYRTTLDSTRFFPSWWNTVFSVRGRIGYSQGLRGKPLPQGERFFVGGINTVRGFEFGRAGPTDRGDVIGGNKQLIFNAEYVFPIVPEAKVKGVVFFDAGKGYDNGEQIVLHLLHDQLRYGAGFGIRVLLPIGPIRLEWGKNLNPEPGEKSNFLPEFSIGTLF